MGMKLLLTFVLLLSRCDCFVVRPVGRSLLPTRTNLFVFRRLFGNERAEKSKRVRPETDESTFPIEKNGGQRRLTRRVGQAALSPEEMMEQAAKLRSEANAQLRNLNEEKLSKQKEKLAGCGVEGAECDVDAINSEINKLEGALKVEISPDREGVGPDSTAKLDGIMKVVVPKEQAVAAPPAGDISNPASKSANATSEDRLDMHADLIVSAYEECPEFLRPIFAKSLGINDFNKTKVRLALFFFFAKFFIRPSRPNA